MSTAANERLNARGYATGLGALSETEARTLITRVAAGDRDAWGQLYEHGRSSVAAYLSRRMPEQADVDDVVHDTFVRLPEMAKDFMPDDVGEVGAWLCGRVARYTLTDYGHRRFRHRAAAAETFLASQIAPPESVEERESRPLSDRMLHALAQLPDAQRKSMQLRYLDNLSRADAAREAGCSPNTVADQCVKARKQLRAQLADLAPTARSWLDALSKKEAVHEAFAAVGEDDVPKVMAWLQDNGVQVTHSYVCGIRKGRYGAAPAGVAADAGQPTRPKPSVKRDRARSVAQQHQDSHGRLPTSEQLAELAGVSSTTAQKALSDIRAELAGVEPLAAVPAPRAAEPERPVDRAAASRRQTDAALTAAASAVQQLRAAPELRADETERERSQQVASWQADDAASADRDALDLAS
ncbi:RNA polymerase sigma factor [Amycolatopsis sp. FDAARGOS 1241]|uniref:RNA polymerase sigma factor n=1 Tax=Amycolatopsis sp. FDAARGOS 1241 TaxID=2778070 RepID=UPI00194F55A6|nr:sigma-70 family RNA polymerase sigma factor [Amycolatopsis sp. FDAARGOS 1241]QRP48867.1 sigma-70 family RNA polymerase sigma factor [Amycolatopsis sp. FDAARGOS 1241]